MEGGPRPDGAAPSEPRCSIKEDTLVSEHLPLISRRAFVGGTLAGLTLLAASPATALAAPTAAEKQAEAQSALTQLNAMSERLYQAEADYSAALSAQQQAQAKMDEAQARIDEASGQIDDLQGKLGSRARSMYRTGSATFLDLLLGATSFQAFTSNWDLLNDMNQDDADMVQQTKDLKAEVEAQKATYAEQERVAAEKAAEMEAVVAESERLVAQTQAVYDNLSAEAAELLAQEEAAREEQRRREAEAELARQQAADPTGTGGAPAAGTAGSGSSSGTGSGSSSGSSGSTGSGSSSGSSSGGSSNNNSRPQTVTGNTVVDRAYSQLGKPYSYGAVGPDSFDCSGLVGYALTGRYSRFCSTGDIIGWPRVTNPQPGDICVVHNSRRQHTGVYIGGGQMIHAPRTGDVVKVASVTSDMVYVRY